jgi:Protein of unknown function (DUF5818)
VRRYIVVLAALAFWLTAWSPSASGASAARRPNLASTPVSLNLRAQAGQNRTQPTIRRFSGTIAKNGDQFVLNESESHKFYELDDQDAASRFVGKSVTITGTLDVVKNIIRIQSIAEAAA